MLNKGIEESFGAFRSGFLKVVMNSPLSKWYLPEELEILLCGSKVRAELYHLFEYSGFFKETR